MRYATYCFIISAWAVHLTWLPALAGSPEDCRRYATSAVSDFANGTNQANARRCHIQPDGRWQANYENHYQWCLTAPKTALSSEQKIRNDYLMGCGARVKFD
jgi:hypothetical protein